MTLIGPIIRSSSTEVIIGYPAGSLYDKLSRVSCPRCGAKAGMPCSDVGMHRARKMLTPSYKAVYKAYRSRYDRGIRSMRKI